MWLADAVTIFNQSVAPEADAKREWISQRIVTRSEDWGLLVTVGAGEQLSTPVQHLFPDPVIESVPPDHVLNEPHDPSLNLGSTHL